MWLATPAAVALAFVVGRWTVAPSAAGGPPGPQRVASSPRPAGDRSPSIATLFAATLRGAETASTAQPVDGRQGAEERVEARPARLRTPLPPEVQTRVREEAYAGLERLRPYVVERCWPRDGLSGGRSQTTLTYNVTFNPEGREVARGIIDDRRAPSGAFGRCLRRLGGTALAISPPGTYVTLKLPVTYASR